MGHSLLLHTDQTRCFDESGREIACDGSGQDAEANSTEGYSRRRFDLQGEVVTDTATGLIWSQNASPAVFPMSWSETSEYIDELNKSQFHGIDAWRLPSRRELFSLISHEHFDPALPAGHPFEEVFNGYYWTASACQRLADQAWYIHLGGGRVYRGMKRNSYMVWPVVSPPAKGEPTSGRFLISGNTAQDRLTERTWLTSLSDAIHPVRWQKALETITELNNHNAGGHIDWRLPNIRELESLVDLNRHSPALAADHPFETIAEGYWSSTTSVYETRYAWVLYPRDGAIGVGFKSLPEFHVWAVRCNHSNN